MINTRRARNAFLFICLDGVVLWNGLYRTDFHTDTALCASGNLGGRFERYGCDAAVRPIAVDGDRS